MRQNAQRLLSFAVGIGTLLVSLEPLIFCTQPALAASEMPILRQLVTPSPGNPIPPSSPLLSLLPIIGVDSTTFSFSAQQGEADPPTRILSVTNRGGGTLSWDATTNSTWLTLSPTSGTDGGTVTLTATTRSLSAGTYNAIITVNATGAAAVTIPVNLTVAPAPIPPTISASPTNFSFTVQRGSGNPAAQTLNISNTGGGTLTWTASDSAAWLALSPASGTGNSTITVTAATGSLAAGTHSGTITISAPGSRSVSVPVTFTVTAAPVPPAIGASPASLSFTAQQGGSNPTAQTLNISNTGSGALTWTASDSAAWLALSPASGINNGTITVAAATGSLATGTYNATIALGATGATNVQVPVTFTVTPAPTSITLSQSSLTYTGVQGGSTPASQGIIVTSNGNWTASDNAAWLTLNPTSGSGNGTISASVNPESASVGTNTAAITVTAGGTTRTVQVTLTVAAPSLTVTPGNLAFTATQGAANPLSQTITLDATGTWTASDDASWLSLSPTSGPKNGSIVASVNTTTANPGNNTATITVTSGGLTKTAIVTLTLNTPSSSSATLTWNANTEKDLAGYKVYRATASGTYGSPIATVLGSVTTYQATGLQFGTTYFFVVTAFDIAGNESAYSNEVSKSIF